MAGRAASIATIWGVSHLLSSAGGRKVAQKVDRKFDRAQLRTAMSVRRGARNARRNRGWLAAGVATLAIATAMLTRAARKG